MAWYHPRLNPPWGVSAVVEERAKDSANAYQIDEYYLPDLGATEKDPEMHMLWSHCQRSQITPQAMKRMKRRHLEYIAAHSGDVTLIMQPMTADGQVMENEEKHLVSGRNLKLQENAFRAKYELERRDRVRGVITTTFIAALIGAIVGGLFSAGILG